MTQEAWCNKFHIMFDQYLVHVDPKFFYEELSFKDPDDLTKIFLQLEEDNLISIHHRQDLEESLEKEKHENLQLINEGQEQVNTHEHKKSNLTTKTEIAKIELQKMSRTQTKMSLKSSKK